MSFFRLNLRILDRYIGGEFVKSFGFALIAFSTIFLAYEAYDLSRIESEQPQIHAYLYLLFSAPRIVLLILPAALMFGVCFTVAQFTVSREMVAIFSAGGSFYRAIAPLLVVSLITSLAQFVFNDFLVTPANEAANEQEEILRKGTRSASVKGLVFQKNMRGREGYYFIYYFNREKQEIFGGFNYLRVSEEGTPLRMWQADRAVYRAENNDWVLYNGRVLIFGSDLRVQEIRVFDETDLKLPDSLDFFANPGRNPNEMNVFELLGEIDRLRDFGFNTVPYEVQFHSNLSFPFMCLILTIVGSIAGATGNHRSGGPLIRAIVLSTIAMFVYYLTFSITEGLGQSGIVHPALASWGPTGFFLAAAMFMVWRYRK